MDVMAERRERHLPRGTWLLVAVRLLLYIGVQASYFIGIIGTLTYELGASTAAIACAVGLFNLLIIAGNTAGGTLLDRMGPRVHTAATIAIAAASSLLFQVVPVRVETLLAMSAAFGFATGLGFMYLSSYPAYLSRDAGELKRVNALLSIASNVAVVAGPALGGAIASVLPAQRVFVVAGALAVIAALPAGRLTQLMAGRRGAVRVDSPGQVDALPRSIDAQPSARQTTFADSARAVFATPTLALLFWVGVLSYAGYGAFDPIESLFYRDVLRVGISWMGWLSSAAGVGSVIGAALAARVPRRHVNVRTLMLLIALEGAGCMLYVGTPYVACALVGQVVLGAAFGMVTPLQNTLVQIHAPLAVLGRVNSVMNAGFSGAGAVPLLAAPALAELFGVQAVLVGASLVVLLVPLVCLVVRRQQIAELVAGERTA